MKILSPILTLLLFVSCANGKEKKFTGSTPAGTVAREFLGISASDSVDFIRWKLSLHDNNYELTCNYGVGKPNTNGFINGGKTIVLNGDLVKEKDQYSLQNAGKVLKLAVFNDDLLHLLDAGSNLLAGNGGWSYTLNNISPSGTGTININTMQMSIGDSSVFVGRTPCKIPGLSLSQDCYKVKWKIILYPGAGKNEPGRYTIYGTNWRTGNLSGNWMANTDKNGYAIYELYNAERKIFLSFLKAGENILLFTDGKEGLLVGDEDFSYTLSRSS